MAGWSGWEAQLLAAIGAPNTKQNQAFLDAWQSAEGGSASYNPLNTTQPAAGSTNYNSVGVKNYPDAATGARATAQTLSNGRYPTLLAALKTGNAPRDLLFNSAKWKRAASELQTWGTGSAPLLDPRVVAAAGAKGGPVIAGPSAGEGIGGRVRPGSGASTIAGLAGGGAAAAGIAGQAIEAASFLGAALWLIETKTWLRVVEFVAGMGLILLGLRGLALVFVEQETGVQFATVGGAARTLRLRARPRVDQLVPGGPSRHRRRQDRAARRERASREKERDRRHGKVPF